MPLRLPNGPRRPFKLGAMSDMPPLPRGLGALLPPGPSQPPAPAPAPRRDPSLRWLFSEPAFYVIVAALALFTRLWLVSAKPLHHDESLFAYYGYFLYRGFGYDYQPILHGPVLQHVSALIFLLFGDSQFTMRLPAILGGLMIFPVAWYWGRYLGRGGAMAALLLLALSPSITYYSRFLRNDVPYLVVTMWCALCLVRALHTGRRRYVFGALFAAALAFCMMESSIFFFAACIGFLGVTTVADWLCWRRAPADGLRRFPGDAVFFVPRQVEPATGARRWLGPAAACLAAAAAVTGFALWIYVRVFQFSLPLDETIARALGASGAQPNLSAGRVVMASLLFPPAVILCAAVMVNFRRPRGERGAFHYFLHVAWKNRWVVLAGFAVAVLMYATLFTTFFTHTRGPDFSGNDRLLTPLQIYKNTWDYWWDQHKLHRIKGPFHYYLPILLLYELPALVVVLTGWAGSLFSGAARWRHAAVFIAVQAAGWIAYFAADTLARRANGIGIPWRIMDAKFHVTGPGHLMLALFYVQMLTHAAGTFFVRGRFVEAFLTFWMVTSIFAYSYAGEKVPWLTVHAAGPMILLAGLYIGRWCARADWTPFRRAAAWTLVAFAVLWQFRNTAFANFVHPASPAERIVYNHTSPDIDFAADRIREIAHRTSLGKRLPILVKGEMEWPLYWYLRDFPNAFPGTAEDASTTSRPVVLVNWEDAGHPNLTQNYVIQRLKVREWWEPPLLDFGAMANIYRVFTTRESRRAGAPNGEALDASLLEWKKLWHYMAYRSIFLDQRDPVFSNNANEFAFCVRKDIDETYLRREWLMVLPKRPEIPVYPEPKLYP